MCRFVSNRSWTLIPALWLVLALSLAWSSEVRADLEKSFEDGIGEGSGGPSAIGDPDLPGTNIKGTWGPGRSAGTRYSVSSTRTAGDSRPMNSDWIWRLKVALRGIWKINFRY